MGLTKGAAVHLIIANQPHGIPIVNTEEYADSNFAPPGWNQFPDGQNAKDWYSTLFDFVDQYLDNDRGMIVLILAGLMHELLRAAKSKGLNIKVKWMCQQREPLIYVMFPNMMV